MTLGGKEFKNNLLDLTTMSVKVSQSDTHIAAD